MELTLTRQSGTQILVTCDSQSSHTFDLLSLLPQEKGLPQPLDDPVAYGQALYTALFPPETLARRTLANMPERILFIASDNDLDAIPWEFAYGPDGFLVLECHFVRGLPANQRIAQQTLESGLHIVAVPSNPLSYQLEPLNIEGEWMRFKEVIRQVPYAITLERARPPTIEQVRTLVVNQRHRVVHFMGHGGQQEAGAVLCFEQDNGDLDLVTAKQFLLRVRGTVFLVTLNACVTATPGATGFSNLAAALVQQRIPYALGMRFSIPDDEARSFSRTFYSDLSRGSSVEESLLQARLTLAKSARSWALGVPVLYTSLTQPAAGFASQAGSPLIREHQPPMEVSTLPRAEGTFQGRIDELTVLGTALTGDSRPPLVTIHGAGGQGKTALAREAVERFAYAWQGGIWATSLENLPGREILVNDLARFLGIDIQKVVDPKEVEQLVVAQLVHRRTLIVLDNVETLVQAVEANNPEAIRMAQFLREQLPRPPVSLLVTSRSFLGWAGEVGYELTGLAPIEGIRLFEQHTPQRKWEIDHIGVWKLSEKVEGHPLSLQLLGSAFNASTIPLAAFAKVYEEELLNAENKYKDLDHRQRTLDASIETSVRYLDAELADFFRRLWLFHAPFLPETSAAIFDPQSEDMTGERSVTYDQLHALWQRSLLTLEKATLREGTLQLYRVLPTIRPYIEKYLARADEREQLLARFGAAYAQLAQYLKRELDRGGVATFIAFRAREDLERGVSFVTGEARGYYLLSWGWILQRLIDTRRGLKLTEQALEIGQGQDRQLELQALINMAEVYRVMGQPRRALELCEQALSLTQEVGDRTGEAATLNNMALVYQVMGQPKRALVLYEQALPIQREAGVRDGEATTLNGIAGVYYATGQLQQALALYERVLPIRQEVGDRDGEAATLNNMAAVYRETGQPQRALEQLGRVLPITLEVGDRTGEATTLNNMALVYDETGHHQQALAMYEQALSLMREVGDRAGEAATLNNMAGVYDETGHHQRALAMYEQALPIQREVGDRAREAATLNNMAEVYRETGQPQRALALYEQALPIQREMGDRAGEATTLNKMAVVYQTTGQLQQALVLFEQALSIRREVGNRAMEASILSNMAVVYQMTGEPQQALVLYEQALPIQREAGDRVGEATTLANLADMLYRYLKRSEEAITKMGQAIAMLVESGLPQDGSGRTKDQLKHYLNMMRLDTELIPRSIEALLGGPQEKTAHVQYLNAMSAQTTNEELKALLQVIQLGLFGSDLSQLGQNINGVYREAWEAIVVSVETGVDPRLFEQIVRNTLAVLGPAADKRDEWRNALTQMRNQAMEGEVHELVSLLDAITGLLDANGNPTGLGKDLAGIYARTWQTIVERLI
jgi:tetratricopeptide (TPR) repeat protein